jgi:hypothetical protein
MQIIGQPQEPASRWDEDQQMLMLHEVPAASQMTPEVMAGAVCLWCGVRAEAATLIDLGGLPPFTPHSCEPCRAHRLASVKTYVEWATHAESCIACTSGARCAVAEPLALAHAAARHQATGTRLVTCMLCRAEDDVSHPRVIPLRWLGTAAVHHGFVHSGSRCPRAVRRCGSGYLRAL